MAIKMPGISQDHSHDRNKYETPQWLFESLDKEFRFEWDLAAEKETAKTKKYLTPEVNALTVDWTTLKGWLWLNPPYSPMNPWLEKVQKSAEGGQGLSPSRRRYLQKHYSLDFYQRRLS